jgi:hypothetical protein
MENDSTEKNQGKNQYRKIFFGVTNKGLKVLISVVMVNDLLIGAVFFYQL